MNSRTLQRTTIIALILIAIGGALAVHLVSTSQLDSRRSERSADARARVAEALRRGTFYLEDIADMVGVHDDADATEFSRYAHVRGRNEPAVLAVQWLRMAPPGGKLVPPHETGPTPILVSPGGGDAPLADAASSAAASEAIQRASQRKVVGISDPVKLSGGGNGFYLAVPVEAHKSSGEVSRAESRSAIVGLVDAHRFLGGSGSEPLSLREGSALLAKVGPGFDDTVVAAVPTPDRH